MALTGELLEQRKQEQLRIYGHDTIKVVAQRLSANITMGIGKTEWAIDQLLEALVNGCAYCHGRIYLDNGVIDHKDPIGGAVRRQTAASQAKKYADRKENLHIICQRCNQLKGDFTDEEYRQLITFLAGKEQLEMKLRRRLQMTGNFYKTQRIAKAKRGYKGPVKGKAFRGF